MGYLRDAAGLVASAMRHRTRSIIKAADAINDERLILVRLAQQGDHLVEHEFRYLKFGHELPFQIAGGLLFVFEFGYCWLIAAQCAVGISIEFHAAKIHRQCIVSQ